MAAVGTDLSDIDLLDLDRSSASKHHEMFKRLRAEDPVSWHDYGGGRASGTSCTHEDVSPSAATPRSSRRRSAASASSRTPSGASGRDFDEPQVRRPA